MITVTLPPQQSTSYEIYIETDLLNHPERWLPKDAQNKRIVIITEDNVKQLYGEMLENILHQYKPLLISFPPGEKSKSYQIKQLLQEKMIQQYCNRETLILALGGGVVGDLAGFVASTYMRGVPYIQIPTTLLSMIDSSVGGKTSINTLHGKNLIGSFWQPSCVVSDLTCLKSLPPIHMINGLIEAIKIFLTKDQAAFYYVKEHLNSILQKDMVVLQNVITRAVQLKSDVVSHDEKESHERSILNFGHTMGHAIETLSDYTILHGTAVALGILVEAKISQLLGFLNCDEYEIIQSLLFKLHISGDHLKEFDPEKIIQVTRSDKKTKSNQVRYVLLNKLGQVWHENDIFTYPVSDTLVKEALREITYDRQ